MTFLDAILLGALQGLTEFLPVSSSGHLVLGQALLELKSAGVDDHASLSFEIIAHLGTLLAVFVYFRRLIWRLAVSLLPAGDTEARKLIWLVALGTIPAGLAGLMIKSHMSGIFSSPTFAASMLLLNGVILVLTGYIKIGAEPVKLRSALSIGVAQALAILPGISRSGSTISAGMFLGVSPRQAAEFSFLLAVPAILGAALLDIDNLSSLAGEELGVYLTGAAVAFVSGLLAIGWLMRLIQKGKFLYFGVYCLALGSIALVLIP